MLTTETKPYVCLSVQSTAQAKYWNYPNGWETVVDALNALGLEVWCVDKSAFFGNTQMNGIPKNAVNKTGLSLEDTMQMIKGCEFFLGISSGLSWLAWAMHKHVILVSGITKPEFEFTQNCDRVINTTVCHGCLCDPSYMFDMGDWMWCPAQKGTYRQFECTKQIAPVEVIKRAKDFINR